jgi:DNA-binding transcriptional LysR family regulator
MICPPIAVKICSIRSSKRRVLLRRLVKKHNTEGGDAERNKKRDQLSQWENGINNLVNIKAFVRVVRLRSFSSAARDLGLAASVITKRVTQLENSLGVQLLVRSTRGLALTAAGDRLLPRFVRLMAEFDEIFAAQDRGQLRLEGHLKVKSPTTITSEFIGRLYAEFQAVHPGISLEIVLVDHSVNPLEEGYDFAIGALPVSYPNVIDVPICPYELVTCCSPSYLAGKIEPQHPTDLIDHECLTTVLFRTTWVFESTAGGLSVEVHSRMHSSDSRVLREAALRGLGIAILPRFLADEPIAEGALIPLLQDFPVATFWLKALVPRIKIRKPAVQELVAFLKSRMQRGLVAQTCHRNCRQRSTDASVSIDHEEKNTA